MATQEASPPWIDAALSECLPDWARVGEHQSLEFKEAFPEQARQLAREIAGFATSNAGTILLGVADTGEIVGVPDCLGPVGRAGIISRIEGICASIVTPIVTPKVRFAMAAGRVVVAIDVPKGEAPVYYADGVPLLRQLTSTRRATPQEVVDLILAWDRRRNPQPHHDPESDFLSELAVYLVDVIVHAAELEDRNFDPWFSRVRDRLALLARQGRDLAAHATGALVGAVAPIEKLADELDKIAHTRVYASEDSNDLARFAAVAIDQARQIRTEFIDPIKPTRETMVGLRETLTAQGRRLSNLAARLEDMERQNRIEEMQSEAGEIGLLILKAATFGLGLGGTHRANDLHAIGRCLRQIQIERTDFADGGQAVERIVSRIRQATVQLNEWLLTFSEEP